MMLKKFIYMTDAILMFAASVALANIKETLGIIGFIVTISYSLWKWRYDYIDRKKNGTTTKKPR